MQKSPLVVYQLDNGQRVFFSWEDPATYEGITVGEDDRWVQVDEITVDVGKRYPPIDSLIAVATRAA